MRTRDFEYDGRKMQVRANQDGEGWVVAVIENGERVASATYSVSNEIASDAKEFGLDCVDELMKTAENDFRNWSDWKKKN